MDTDQRMTWSWLRKYFNQYKNASYRDKLDAILAEKNPFYLLEWILFPAPEQLKEELSHLRSPARLKNSYTNFKHVFFDQLLLDICFGWSVTDPHKELLFVTAAADMRQIYGKDRWNEAVSLFLGGLHESVDKYKDFKQRLEQVYTQLQNDYEKQRSDIMIQYEEEESEKQFKLSSAREAFLKKKEDAPKKLLQSAYDGWPWLAYWHYSNGYDVEARVQQFESLLMQQGEGIYMNCVHGERNYAQVYERFHRDKGEAQRFIAWYIAYASKTNMNRGYIDTENRQKWWSGLLEHLAIVDQVNDVNQGPERNEYVQPYADAVFEITGMEQILVTDGEVPPYFHLLVMAALHDDNKAKWLREMVILRYWPLFIAGFAHRDYSFNALSWVLCLDPESLMQRLLRREPATSSETKVYLEPGFIVERCSDIFADGIRAGLPSRLLIPIFQYLAVHDKEVIYRYILKIKQFSELDPVTYMEPSYADRIFSGDSAWAKSSRKHMIPLFLEHLRHGRAYGEDNLRLTQTGKLLYADRGDLIMDWMESLLKAESGWPTNQAAILSDIFDIDWIRAKGTAEEQHEQVEQWLSTRSDWVKFDLDVRYDSNDAVRFRIIRPGVLDKLTGKVLARVVVRPELVDQHRITDLLDELKNL
jgi:hypothetical protein